MRAPHIDTRLGTPEQEAIPNRKGYGQGLLEAGEKDARIVALSADLTESTQTHFFAEKFPERFVQVGIAEQNMASVAAGMAAMGKIPFIASYAMFSPGRSWEQVRTTIAYNNSNVKIIGAHAGLSVGPDGATHQAIEDVAIMRVIPNMVVIAPADVEEARKAVHAAVAYPGPVYIRIAREKTPVVTTVESPFTIGKGERMFTRTASYERMIGFVVTGTLLCEAILAAEALEREGIGVSVLHLPTVKPLDQDAVVALAEEHGQLVTIEEHQVAGGLGSAVAECLAARRPTKIGFVGVHDRFGQSGTAEELMREYGIDQAAIIAKAKAVLG